MMGLFSIQTITALIDVVTGGSNIGVNRRTGPQIELLLGKAGIGLHIGKNSRVPAVKGAIHQVNEQDNDAIKRLIEQVADPIEYYGSHEKCNRVVEYLNERLSGDGYELKEISGKYRLVKLGTTGAATVALTEMANQLDFESVQADFERALTQAENDPEDAVTSSCSTLESVCKCLLDEMEQPYPSNKDIAGLAQAVENNLNLSPGREDVEPDIKRILGGLANVSRGIGSLRTHCGDAHGRGKGINRIDSRIARLAIHSASTVALFFIETWQKKN